MADLDCNDMNFPYRLLNSKYDTMTTKKDKDLIIRSLIVCSKTFTDEYLFLVEIGTCRGKTGRVIIDIMNRTRRKSIFYTVDIVERVGVEEVKGMFEDSEYVRGGTLLGGSMGVKNFLPEKIHWIFIDGCHCYECVNAEIKEYVPRVVPGGFVLFHDCAKVQDNSSYVEKYHGDKRNIGIFRAVHENKKILSDFKLEEIRRPKPKKDNKFFGGMHMYRRLGGVEL